MNQKNRNLKSSIYNLKSLRQHAFTIHRLVKDREPFDFTQDFKRSQIGSGFTIVELLVVIVVIGILALISTVAYSGIADRARSASLQADLKNAATILEMDKINSLDNTYPPTLEDANGGNGLTPSGSNVFDYTYNAGANTYTLTATNGDLAYQITSDDTMPVAVNGGSTPVSFAVAWGDTGDDFNQMVIQTSDGGYAVVGITYSFGSEDVFLAKYDNDGDLVWDKIWGGGNDDFAAFIIQTDDDGYVIAGSTESYGAGSSDAFLVKYDINGTLAWDKTWGGTGYDSLNSIIQTEDGGFAIIGGTNSYGAGGEDAFIAKYDSSGNLAWDKTWGGTGAAFDYDSGFSIIQTTDGGYAVTGSTYNFGAGNNDAFLVKYDGSGNLMWDKTWGGSGNEAGYQLIGTSDNGYLIAGDTESFGTGDSDIFIAKYDSSGNLIWDKCWGGDGDEYAEGYPFIVGTADGGYIVTSGTDSFSSGDVDAFVVKYDSSGSLDWDKIWGGSDIEYPYFVNQTTDNDYIVAGETGSFGSGGTDLFVARYDSDGSLVWDTSWGGEYDEYSYGMALTDDGGCLATGNTSSYTVGGADALLVKFLANGTISSCSSPMCQNPNANDYSPSANDYSPSASDGSPSASDLNPSASDSSPSALEYSPSAIVTVIVAPE